MTRPFRFAIQAFSATSLKEWVDLARKVESSGFSTLHVADHLLGPGSKIEGTGHRVQTLALIPALTSAAMATSTLRIGSRMACVSYHLPTVLTKEMASIDVISEGRLEIGLGAGWLVNEYEAMGIPFESAGRRIQLLRETAEFMRMAYADEAEVDYHGEFIESFGYHAVPATVQRPRPPLMIGGGAPKVLGLAGELADIVSVNFNNSGGVVGAGSISSSTDEETLKKIGWIRDGAGARFADIELETAAYFISVEGRSQITAEAVMARTGMDLDQLHSFPHAAVGSVDEICEQLVRRREEYGFSYITVGDAHLDAFIPVVERLAGT
ncbi:MAG: TIGR03621 family F420-dependent LLM class oxidoreductase [Actinobacteria bacterium]|nr:TIGR03621 family F420-dependent LLM class oxidoreductase [Actinomycetota bacterium]